MPRKKATFFFLETGPLCRRKIKLPERASGACLCRALKSSLEKGVEVLVPCPYSRFYVFVLSDEIKCIAVLSTTEILLEAPCIYDTEHKAIAKQQGVIITV